MFDKRRLYTLAVIFIAAVGIEVCSYFVYPWVPSLKKTNPAKSAMMELREREWKSEGRKMSITKTWVPLTRISPYIVRAVLISEDDKFWTHEGFDFDAMEKAMEKDIKKKKLRAGGSTISQQLAKNLYLSPSRDPVRKLKEAILTWRIERNLTKRRIIELYLNEAEWGDGIFGIEAAARRYYGRPASALGPSEAAMLASVLPNPRKYSPVHPSGYVSRRAAFILKIMVRRGIVEPEYEDVIAHPDDPDGAGAKPAAPVVENYSSVKPEAPEHVTPHLEFGSGAPGTGEEK
jgi:monofunctional biosynthetic peptidoglycan transglycosylase